MTGTQRIAEYVAAVRARDALVQHTEPEDVVGYWPARRAAVQRVKDVERTLTGGQLGKARRRLAQLDGGAA